MVAVPDEGGNNPVKIELNKIVVYKVKLQEPIYN